ncbi:MAG TPA: PadR family transcriptional regulator [Candidatus Binatia bacterium]|nr:PadR family transcriptional regulator [Candidatus Binatia bacterium]
MLRYVLLALLADGRATHGYALMKAYAERSGVRLSIGNIYRELQRLVAAGWITTVANPVGADARRAPYTITAAGRQALLAWLTESAQFLARPVPDELAHRLALIGDVDPELATRFLDDLHAELWERAKVLERDRGVASHREQEGDRSAATRSLLLGRSARHLAADIELVQEMRARFVAATPKAQPQPQAAKPAAPVAVPERRVAVKKLR